MSGADEERRPGRTGGHQGPKRRGRRTSYVGPTRPVAARSIRSMDPADILTDDAPTDGTGARDRGADDGAPSVDPWLVALDVAPADSVVDDAEQPIVTTDAAAPTQPDDDGNVAATTLVADDDLTADATVDGVAAAALPLEDRAPVTPEPQTIPIERSTRSTDALLASGALDWAAAGKGKTGAKAATSRTAAATRARTERTSHRGRWAVIALVLMGLGGAGSYLAFRAADSGGDAQPVATGAPAAPATTAAATTSAAPTAATTAAPTSAAPTTAVPVTTEAPATTTASDTTVPDTTVPATPATTAPLAVNVASTATNADGTPQLDFFTPIRWAIFKDGKVTLLGKVPSKDIADLIAGKAAAVVGPDNVIVNYEIDPSAPVPPSAPLYVRNTVQFDPGSTVVRPEFASLLKLGVTLMQQNAGVHIWVIGRADAIGSEADNLRLSGARSEAVIDVLVAAGIDRSRLTAVPLGTGSALGDNSTEEGRALNRSVEFVIGGLLS